MRAPAVIGANAKLDKYGTAQGLLSFTSSAMPANSPGSLTADKYQAVIAFLLVQNNYITGASSFDPNSLSGIPLKK